MTELREATGAKRATAARARTVIHVLGILDRGGAERRILELIRALERDRVRFMICTLSGFPGSMAKAYDQAGARVVPLRIRDPRFAIRFIRLLRREHVDVVHSHVHFSSALILGLAWVAGISGRIAHFRSDSDGHDPTPTRRVRNNFFRLILRHTATAVVGVAPGTLDATWGKHWRQDPRCVLIPNGIDLDMFVRRPPSSLRRDLGIRPGERVSIHLGRADIPTKNRELAIRITGELGRLHFPWHLVFVGRDGSSLGDAAQRVEALRLMAQREGVADRVHFLGEREDVPDLLSSADLLLLTSTREGLPGVLLEATACGIPAVSSGVPGAIYIAESLASVTIVPIGTSVAGWARAIHERSSTSSSNECIAASLSGTQFDIAVSLERYRSLWKLT